MVSITGASLSGTSGQTDRTYTVADNQFTETNLQIFVSGTYLYNGVGKDYTVNDKVITFLNAVFDDQLIEVIYPITTVYSYSSGTPTTLQLANFMGIAKQLPDLDTTDAARTKETVGVGDNIVLVFWLDKGYVLADSYTLYYGSVETTTTSLTETTHYVLDKNLGKITLTTAGRTLLGTNTIYAAYSYCNVGITDSQLSDALARARNEVDKYTNGSWFSISQHLDEAQDGKGWYDRNYFTDAYPIPDVSTTLDGDVTAGDATITVVSTTNFPTSGYILIGNDKITYTGTTSTTFTGCTSVEAHSDGDTVRSYVIEISTTEAGGTISWDILSEGTEFELDRNTGKVHLYDIGYDDSPEWLVANRFRTSYLSGSITCPVDIAKLNLMIAARDMMGMVVRKAHSTGLNEFNPGQLDVDKEEIDKIILANKNEKFARC